MPADSAAPLRDVVLSPSHALLAEGLRYERGGDGPRALSAYEQVLRAASRRDAKVEDVVMALLRIVAIHLRADHRDVAAEIAEAGAFIAAANGLSSELAHALVAQSTILLADEKLDQAERLALTGRAQAEATSTEIAVAIADNVLGIIASRAGNGSDALLRFASSLAYGQRAGDMFFAAMCLTNIGRTYVALGMPDEAIPHLEEAISLGTQHHPVIAATAEATLATVHAERGATDRAERHAERAMAAAVRLESARLAAFAYVAQTLVAISTGKLAIAESTIRLGEALGRHDRGPELDAEIATCKISLHMASGRPGPALAEFERAMECYAKEPDAWGQRRVSERAEELDRLIRDQSDRWLRALSAHVPHAGRHAHRVAQSAATLADVIGVSESDRRAIVVGATLHDIGALSLPSELLRRVDPLNSLDRNILGTHAEFGDARLMEAGYPASVRQVVRHHHERWDGTGYPDGLRADGIPLGARIVAIAERYDALRSSRGARVEFSEGSALKRLEAEAGRALDPRLCAEFATAVRTGRGISPRPAGRTLSFASAPSLEAAPAEPSEADGKPARDMLDTLQDIVGPRYRLQRELGGSAMAHVYLAHDPVLARQVVIKAIQLDDVGPNAVARFRREMALAARIRHPNVLPVLDARIDPPMLYFVTPFIAGGSLRARIDRGPMRVGEAMRVLRDIADALTAAHIEGVVHRDIKPENILLDSARQGTALLADFGIARVVTVAPGVGRGSAGGRLTHTGVSLGTPDYMAPEQVFAQTELDARVDVYAFGLVAYEILTGVSPFVRGTAREVMVAQLTATAPRLTSVRSDVPDALADLVVRSLEKAPDDRFADGGALLAALTAITIPSDAA